MQQPSRNIANARSDNFAKPPDFSVPGLRFWGGGKLRKRDVKKYEESVNVWDWIVSVAGDKDGSLFVSDGGNVIWKVRYEWEGQIATDENR